MATLNVRLFGKLDIQRDGQALAGLDVRKLQEFFCYLLLNRQRPQPRETLAGLLCADCPTAQSRKNLRQSLWQLQAALNVQDHPAQARPLIVEPEWVCLNPEADLWLDVDVFESAFSLVQGTHGEEMEPACSAALVRAVELYRGDLLEGWYLDWCLYERERLQNMYLSMLDKLMAYCEVHQDYENGLVFGSRILCYDRARERTHQRLMRLHYLAGDRAAALRQFERCRAALHEELGVQPARRTMALYEQIRADRLDAYSVSQGGEGRMAAGIPAGETSSPAEALGRLKQLQVNLAELQRQLQRELQALEQTLKGQQ